MPGIIRPKSRFSSISGDRKKEILYCKKCYDVGLPAVLGSRIYGENEVIPADFDNWRQCHTCGELYPLFEIRGQPDNLESDIEPLKNPFQQIGAKMFPVPWSRYHKGKEKHKSQLNKYSKSVYKVRTSRLEDPEDEDIRSLIKQGHKVEYQR